MSKPARLTGRLGRVSVMAAALLMTGVCGSQPVFADQKQIHAEMIEVLEAYAVHKMGQYDKAFPRWMALAEKGNAQGILNVANFYLEGKGVEQDAAQAVYWYRKGAEQGDPHCLYNLAHAYDTGRGVEADAAKAAAYYQRAAGAGSTDAQGVLARSLLEKGETEEARYWLERAADLGDESASRLLASLGGSVEPAATEVDPARKRRIKDLIGDMDAAANARDTDLLTTALDEQTEILVRLPGDSAPRQMTKDEFKALWRATFDGAERYRFARTRVDQEALGEDVRVRSLIREYLTSAGRTQLLILNEDLVVSLNGDTPRVAKVLLTVEEG